MSQARDLADFISGGTVDSPTFTGTVSLPTTTSIGDVSSSEIEYLNGVNSEIQTQFNEKSPIESPIFTGSINLSRTSRSVSITSDGQLVGGIGAATTGGTTDWNDVSNARSGTGYTLLLGTAANGFGVSAYFHAFSFEYVSKDGSGNMTQLAIGYSVARIFVRYRYNNNWSSWVEK